MDRQCVGSQRVSLQSRRPTRALRRLPQTFPCWPISAPRNCDQAEGEQPALTELQRLGLAPQTAERFRNDLHAMNRAAHGMGVATAEASEATEIAAAVLAELQAIRNS